MYSVRNSLLLFVLILSFFTFPFFYASAATSVAADVVSDTTWTIVDSPYIISNSIRVAQGATLTIDPGVIVQFEYGTEVDVDGSLVANGNADQLIHITSISDNTLVADESDTDESESIEEEGDEEFDFIFEPFAGDYAGFVFLDGSSGTFTSTEIRYASTAILSTNATLTFNNSSILNTYAGIDVVGGVFTVTQSTISMSEIPVLVDYLTMFTHSGNTFTDTTYNGIGMFGDPYGNDYTFTAGDGPYILFSNPSFATGTTLTIEPGVTLQSDGEVRSIGLVGANMSALGTPNAKIVLDGINLDVFDHAVAILKHTEIKNTFWSAINVWDNGSLDADALTIGSVPRDGIDVFLNGSISLKNSTISNFGDYSGGIVVFNNANATITDSTIENGGDGIVAFNHAVVDAERVTIRNYRDAGVITFGTEDFDDTVVKIRMSEMTGGVYGIYPGNHTVLDVSKNSIHGNTYGAYADFGDYNLADNWWGDESGPKNIDTNSEGLGNEIYGPIAFSPWRKRDPLIASRTPVIIVPGIMGSELRQNFGDDEEIWPNVGSLLTSFSDDFLDDLVMQSDGTEDPMRTISVGDIVRKITLAGATLLDTWGGLIDTLTAGGYTEGEDLFVFPYDWRMSDNAVALSLKSKIDQILSETDAEQINIVAHSMGGLVAKKYIADNGGDKVDKLFFIGTPHLGAPKAFKVLMYGDDMGIKRLGVSLLNQRRVKMISQNMPSIFNLLPSRNYVDGNPDAEILFPNKYVYDSESATWLDYEATKDFMVARGRNGDLFAQAETLHSSTNSLDLSGVDVYNFAGCGTTKTIARIITKKKKTWNSFFQKVVDDFKLDYTNGDETVPLSSAIGPYDNNFYVRGLTHAELPSDTEVSQAILSLLGGGSVTSTSIISTDSDDCDVSGRVVSTHSPVVMHIYDNHGNHTGPNENGDIEYGVPGVTYDVIEGAVFAFLPEDGTYRIVTKATDTGAYDFHVALIGANDIKTGEVYWHEIPLANLTTNTEIEFFPSVDSYVIKMDEDGDGIFESTFLPSSTLIADMASDVTPPVTTTDVSTGGMVKLSAIDDNSGILKTEYSFDGSTWSTYSVPFPASGRLVQYFSVDNMGNTESSRSINVPAQTVVAAVQGGSGGRPYIILPPLDTSFEAEDKIEQTELNDPIIPTFPTFAEFTQKPILSLSDTTAISDFTAKNDTLSRVPLTASASGSAFPVKPIVVVISILGVGVLAFVAKKYILKR